MGKISNLRLRRESDRDWQKTGLQDTELAMLKGDTAVSGKSPPRSRKSPQNKTGKKSP